MTEKENEKDLRDKVRRIKSAVRMMNEHDSDEELYLILDNIQAKATIKEIRSNDAKKK